MDCSCSEATNPWPISTVCQKIRVLITFFLSPQQGFDFAYGVFDRDSTLRHAVSVTNGDGVILKGLTVDGQAPWGADFIMSAVSLPDGVLWVVGGVNASF